MYLEDKSLVNFTRHSVRREQLEKNLGLKLKLSQKRRFEQSTSPSEAYCIIKELGKNNIDHLAGCGHWSVDDRSSLIARYEPRHDRQHPKASLSQIVNLILAQLLSLKTLGRC